MKFTNRISRSLAVLLTTFTAIATLSAQSAYIAAAPTLNESDAPTGIAGDDPQNSMLTLHARVNEVNVLFIATDKHGKFVRDLNQTISRFWTITSRRRQF